MTQKTFIMNFYCSVTDKPFTVRFKRQNDYGIFFVADIQKSIPSSGNHKNDEACAPSEMEAGSFSPTEFQCPHCDHDGSNNIPVYFQCGKCMDYVCGGKSGKVFFRCRPSCTARSLRFYEKAMKICTGISDETKNGRSASPSSSGETATLQLTHSKNQNLTR